MNAPSIFAGILSLALFVAVATGSTPARAQQPPSDRTCFQTSSGYQPEIDVASDVSIVYGVGADFRERADSWREQGYAISLMTGIAWGGYGSYYGSGDAFKKDEVQTTKSGRLYMHGNSTDVGYNVPSPAYIEYIKQYIDPALECDILGVYLEEPEYWAETGWSKAFQEEWQRFYNEPWQEPDSSVDAQYRASRLKYELYFNALKEVFEHVDKRAAERGRTIECHVPTHSLINYAQWRIVSPESHLIDIPSLDGYIAQVWTGTARCANLYRGVRKERTFETAYLEYGQMFGMVKPTGKKVWFLADPIEDNPDRSWADYKLNYECTVIASLLWPEVSRFEAMPWPTRIFKGAYPKVDMDTKSGDREGIPADYATELLTVINALNDMDQADVTYETGSRGIGVVVSDTLMFQRAAPKPSDPMLSCFYGLALPFVKHGVPIEMVQLENTIHPGCLEPYTVLFLTYEGQKPLNPEYHAALDRWVRAGGGLVFIDDGSDPYHHVREWWNNQGQTDAMAYDDLFSRLGVTDQARREPQPVEKGFVRVVETRPSGLATETDGADRVIALASEMRKAQGASIETQHYLKLRRGPYVIASVLEESVSEAPLTLAGRFVDLFDPALAVVTKRELAPGQRCLLYDLDYAVAHGYAAKVAAAAARVRQEKVNDKTLTFTTRGPIATHANVRVLLPAQPSQVAAMPETAFEQHWDAASSTLLLSFDNTAADIGFRVSWD